MDNTEYIEKCLEGMSLITNKSLITTTNDDRIAYLVFEYALHLERPHEDIILDFRECTRCLRSLEEVGFFNRMNIIDRRGLQGRREYNQNHPFKWDNNGRPDLEKFFDAYNL